VEAGPDDGELRHLDHLPYVLVILGERLPQLLRRGEELERRLGDLGLLGNRTADRLGRQVVGQRAGLLEHPFRQLGHDTPRLRSQRSGFRGPLK
jgi:hypothetical protein